MEKGGTAGDRPMEEQGAPGGGLLAVVALVEVRPGEEAPAGARARREEELQRWRCPGSRRRVVRWRLLAAQVGPVAAGGAGGGRGRLGGLDLLLVSPWGLWRWPAWDSGEAAHRREEAAALDWRD